MKNLLLFLLLSCGSLYGQITFTTPYMKKMDSLALVRLPDKLVTSSEPDKIRSLQASRYVKFTLKTYVQTDILVDLIDNDVSFDDLDLEDIAAIGKYDVRMKVYLTRDIRFLSRLVASGISTQSYTYSFGFILKF